jgi:hypothetical protein
VSHENAVELPQRVIRTRLRRAAPRVAAAAARRVRHPWQRRDSACRVRRRRRAAIRQRGITGRMTCDG